MKDLDTYRLVMVNWVDSTQAHPEWVFFDGFEGSRAVDCHSVGWLIEETDKDIILAPNVAGLGTDSAQLSAYVTIPRCSVTNMQQLFCGDRSF